MCRDALVIGEALVDIVHAADGTTVEHAGGSAANVAVALARLGRPVRFATAWSDDARGRMLAEHLARAGVELATDPVVLERTATASATIGADGAASYDFDLEWRLGPVEPGQPVAVHVCSIGVVLEPGAGQVLELLGGLRGTTTISYDVNARPAITGTGPDVVAQVERMAAAADLVKASDEDLATLYPALDVDAAARHLLALGPTAVVVTRAARARPGSTRRGPSRSRRCRSRSPTRSGRATRSVPRWSTPCGVVRSTACPPRRSRRCSRTPPARRRSRSRDPARTRRTARSSRAPAPGTRGPAARRRRPRRWRTRPASSSPSGRRPRRRCRGRWWRGSPAAGRRPIGRGARRAR